MEKPNALEQVTLSIISGFKPDDLRHAVQRRARLVDLIQTFMPPVAIKAIRLSASLYRSDGNLLTYDTFMSWLSLQRPELHQTILESQENIRWVQRNLKEIKRMFLG